MKTHQQNWRPLQQKDELQNAQDGNSSNPNLWLDLFQVGSLRVGATNMHRPLQLLRLSSRRQLPALWRRAGRGGRPCGVANDDASQERGAREYRKSATCRHVEASKTKSSSPKTGALDPISGVPSSPSRNEIGPDPGSRGRGFKKGVMTRSRSLWVFVNVYSLCIVCVTEIPGLCCFGGFYTLAPIHPGSLAF